MMDIILRTARLPLFLIGLALFFTAERYYSSEHVYGLVLGLGLGAMVLATLIPFLLAKRSQAKGFTEEARGYRWLGFWQAIVLLSPVLFLVYRRFMPDAIDPETFLQKLLLVAWVAPLVLGLAAGIGLEIAFMHHGHGEHADLSRVRSSGLSWLKVGLLLGALVALNYTAVQKDRSFDWSYFKSTRPGESTQKMVAKLDKPLEVVVFFPYKNEVLPYVMDYVSALQQLNPQIQVKQYDKDVNPVQAEEFKVTQNGQIVLRYEDRREKIDIGTKITQARPNLRKFDSLFQQAFLTLTSKQKIAYFYRGHDEMDWSSTQDPLRLIRGVEILLRSQNYDTRYFGSTEGSLQAVPEDASLIVIAGPAKPFIKEEVDVIRAYLAKGGKMFLLFDQDVDTSPAGKKGADPLQELAAEMGVTFKAVPLANDQQFVRAARTDADHWFLFTNTFSSHPSVENLSRNDDRAQLLLLQSGYLELAENEKWNAVEAIKTTSSTFADVNRNYKFDEGKETRKSYVVGAALQSTLTPEDKEKGEESAKVFVVADTSLIADSLIRNPSNQIFLVDAVRWLAGDSDISGEINTEEDVRIRHTKTRELFVFHASIFAMPLLVLLVGFVATRRRKGDDENA